MRYALLFIGLTFLAPRTSSALPLNAKQLKTKLKQWAKPFQRFRISPEMQLLSLQSKIEATTNALATWKKAGCPTASSVGSIGNKENWRMIEASIGVHQLGYHLSKAKSIKAYNSVSSAKQKEFAKTLKTFRRKLSALNSLELIEYELLHLTGEGDGTGLGGVNIFLSNTDQGKIGVKREQAGEYIRGKDTFYSTSHRGNLSKLKITNRYNKDKN